MAFAAYRFVDAVLLNPPDPNHGDMLTVIEMAGRRFLKGRDPYATYQVPWQVNLPYGPPLWAPFLVPQVLRIDLRLLTASGQLFVPVCCGSVAVLEAARARPVSAAAWVLLLTTLVFNPDLLRFVSVGHTPAYWPLLPLVSVLIVGERWYAAAAVLGVLVAARATMIAVVPIFFMTVWFRDRSRALGAGLIWTAVVAAILLPFFLWDPVADVARHDRELRAGDQAVRLAVRRRRSDSHRRLDGLAGVAWSRAVRRALPSVFRRRRLPDRVDGCAPRGQWAART